MIVCWNVFKHLPHPERALGLFCDPTRPGGLIVFVFPNPLSVKGLVTKVTPFWVHVWVTRHLIGRKLAGTEGHPPYPTFMRWSAAPGALIRSAAKQGFTPAFLTCSRTTSSGRSGRSCGSRVHDGDLSSGRSKHRPSEGSRLNAPSVHCCCRRSGRSQAPRGF